MKITKLIHSSFIADTGHGRVLFDPGSYVTRPETLTDIDVVVVTHEHTDHCLPANLKIILEHNPNAVVATNAAVHQILNGKGIPSVILAPGQPYRHGPLTLEAVGKLHAEHHRAYPRVANIGVIVDNTLYSPGDSFTPPGRPVQVLALPVAGGWMKLSEAIDFALELKPKFVFPIHEALLKKPGTSHDLPKPILEEAGIRFEPIPDGSTSFTS